ncbi:MAG: helix-turn-helix transcriptional regulator [Rhodospirillales bacterium]|nr:helix-turn-helix transcriptional regulator [Rhodospirillales bacterium]
MSHDDGPPTSVTSDGADLQLQSGRGFYQRRCWAEAYQHLSIADRAAPLQAADLELLGMSAYLIGRDEDYLGAIERGYLLLPAVEQLLAAGDCQAAYAAAAKATAIGERCREADLTACALHLQGRIRLEQGQIEAGLALLDEAMVAVTAGELSPLMTGLLYCSVIETCQQVHALGRAREWTFSLARWCEKQPEMMAFSGVCRVHCAEIMQLRGAWQDAIEEAGRAIERAEGVSPEATAAAYYQQAEVHRLRGEFSTAERAYGAANQHGLEPQPGLALLRLGQGLTDAASAAIRRLVSTTADRKQRTKLLPGYIEIMVAAGDLEAADSACRELEEIAAAIDTEVLNAIAAHARGAICLAAGDAAAALGCLQRARQVWQQIEAPYLAARARVLAGLACRILGDDDGGGLELEAARTVFEQLGAVPDLDRLDQSTLGRSTGPPHGLTPRELQVLRLIASGKTNKSVAALLFVSERTIDRHVCNIFTKLDVPSRAAATAYAYQHRLV